MKEKWKKIIIILLHIICAAVVLSGLMNAEKLRKKIPFFTVSVPGHVKDTTEKTDKLTPTPTATPTVAPTLKPTEGPTPTPEASITPTPTNTPAPTASPYELRLQHQTEVAKKIAEGVYEELSNEAHAWWFKRKLNHVPSGSGEGFDMDEYSAFYRNKNVDTEDKVIYITIDCGYGSSNTPVMLDIFKKHNVKVTFFVTKYFVDANPDYVKRMIDEGHMVGNHTANHPDLTTYSSREIFDELVACEEAVYNATEQLMDMYFRAPEGVYSKRVLQIIEDMGYKTMFWSIAYRDFDKNNQPTVDEIMEHFETYHHNGALVLMHNDSDGNRDAMDQVLTYLEEQGYRFGTLDEFN